jgi:hypothetical protein
MTNAIKTKETITAEIIAYFEKNENIFNACIEELDGYNGYLGDDRYFKMEMINEFYHGTDPLDVLYRTFYGHDEDNYNTDANGNREYAEFNPNREYFKFNAYGNLVSTNYPDYSHLLDRYFIEALAEDRQSLYEIDDNEYLTVLFDELDRFDENGNYLYNLYGTYYTAEELRYEYEGLTGAENNEEMTDDEIFLYLLEAYKEPEEE